MDFVGAKDDLVTTHAMFAALSASSSQSSPQPHCATFTDNHGE